MTLESNPVWQARADAIIERVTLNPLEHEEASKEGLALVNERLDEVGLRGKVWGAMRYACERCRRDEWREMEVGVEGPPGWRTDNTFIPTAFTSGRCSQCSGTMSHIDFAGDWDYGEAREPTTEWVYRVPREPIQSPTFGMDEDGSVMYSTSTAAMLVFNFGAAVAR